LECVKREFAEEVDIDIEVIAHFYTTDFFVESAFNNKQQIMSINNLVGTDEVEKIKVTHKPHDYEKKDGAQSFRWISLKCIDKNDFTFIIDQKIGQMLSQFSE
ncbi:MAG: NUDIX hydrolase, partial [Bacteroidia bacterium]